MSHMKILSNKDRKSDPWWNSVSFSFALGLVWKMVNTWPKKFLCNPFSKIGALIYLYPEFLEKKKQIKKSWFLVNSQCFCFAFHANLTLDGKNKRLKFLFITPLILLINMSISLFRWRIWLIKFPLQRQQSYVV